MSKGNGESLPGASVGGGDGDVEMVIFDQEGQIIMRFRKSMEWIGFDPANAVAIGKQLIDLAVTCGADVEIIIPRQQVTREQRAVLVKRTENIVRSMSAGGRPIDFIAQQVVDSILAGIE